MVQNDATKSILTSGAKEISLILYLDSQAVKEKGAGCLLVVLLGFLETESKNIGLKVNHTNYSNQMEISINTTCPIVMNNVLDIILNTIEKLDRNVKNGGMCYIMEQMGGVVGKKLSGDLCCVDKSEIVLIGINKKDWVKRRKVESIKNNLYNLCKVISSLAQYPHPPRPKVCYDWAGTNTLYMKVPVSKGCKHIHGHIKAYDGYKKKTSNSSYIKSDDFNSASNVSDNCSTL